MDRKTLIGCTAAIVVTMVICMLVLHHAIYENVDWLLRALPR